MATEGADQPSAGLLLNLSSNNPFRNRAVSPSLQSPASPFDDPPPRPVSRNPFLDPNAPRSMQDLKTDTDRMAPPEKKASPTAEDIFDSLTLEDQSAPLIKGLDAPPPRPDAANQASRRGPPSGRENLPPGTRRAPPPGHRPSRSQEEAMRARRAQGKPQDSQSPQRRPERRLRRNSDSSAMEKQPLTEEEKKEREARRRDRERRHRERDGKDKKPASRKLDIIDQLDATSIFGTGLFHHDGPFDAVNPHRNRPGSRRAPMQAFPKDSLNNVIGGSGPLNKRPDHATFLGQNNEDAFLDYSNQAATKGRSGSASYADAPTARPRGDMPVFDPTARGSILHGDESLGLGTSTFLEGTPAARTAIQKREEERAADIMDGGIQRKKSLAQRIRGINRPPRGFEPSGRMTNPEGVYGSRRSPSGSYMPASARIGDERNPFFEEYETGKGEESISVRRTDGNVEPNSPKYNPLERRATNDAAGSSDKDESQSKQSGLLARVKSLKGGKRSRPTRSPSSTAQQQGPPGQAV
ncbi:Pal1 cell morphology protein-domain-containing protein [Coniochaeta sp. 2T2.1]|nr:Pal1 cell morphology protein-domain-containing protein [Coniochaeta sp. 2T2.1]